MDAGIFTSASTNLIYATNFMALIALYHTDLTIQPWMTFVAYQGLNLLTAGIVMFGNRFIPLINKFSRESGSGSGVEYPSREYMC